MMEDLILEYMDEERYDEALELLIEHENEFMDRAIMLERKAWLLNRAERYEEALIVLDQLHVLGEEDPWYYSQLGYAKSRLDAYDEALDAYFKAQALGRDDAWLDTEIASVYGKMDYYEEAKEFLVQAFDKEPESVWTNSQLGYTFIRLGDLKSAYDYYYNAYQLGRDDTWLLSELAWICNKLQRCDEALTYLDAMKDAGYIDDWCRLEYAVAYNTKDEYETALMYINQIEDDTLDGYLMQKGWALLRLERIDEALETYLKIEYKDLLVTMELVAIYAYKEDYETEDYYIHEAYKMGCREPELYYELAKTTRHYRKDYAKAIEYLKTCLEMDPENIPAIVEVAQNYVCLEDYDQAITWYKRCLELNDEDIPALYYLCRLYERTGQMEESYEYFQKLASNLPYLDQDMLTLKAYLLRNLERPEEALDILNQLDEKSAWVYNEYGIVFMQLNKLDDAIVYFEKALQEDERNEDACVQLGDIYFVKGNYLRAMDYYFKAVEYDAMTPYLAYQLGVCSENLDQYKQALGYYELLLKLHGDNEEVKERIKRIKAKTRLFNFFQTK